MSNPDLKIREPTIEDIPALQSVFEHWIKDRDTGAPLPDEVQAVEDAIATSITGENPQRFLVAEESGRVLGIMGIQPPDRGMRKFTTTPRPMELITALVSDQARGRGIGKALVDALTKKAVEEGATELVVNSGPRYQSTGWPFWNKLFGEPVGVAKSYYGPGGDAKVWRRFLNK